MNPAYATDAVGSTLIPMERSAQRVLLSVPHMGGLELDYVREAFATNWLSTVGPNLIALEKAFTALVGLPSVALASGTAGIHLGLRVLGIQPGDEVISPTLTFAASCNPILYLKAIPVFIDSEARTWNLDPNLLADFLQARARINKLPKAVIVVHLFGQSADMEPIMSICRQYELPVLEDAAESLGALYKGRPSGTFGDVGVYSFNGNKIITCTGGGMLVSSRAEWVERVRYWSTQARDPDPEKVNNYVHSEVGYNYRLSNVLAGIARGQLEVLEQRVQQRRTVFERYRTAFEKLPGVEAQPEAESGDARRGETQCATTVGPGTPDRTTTSARTAAPLRTRHTRWLSCFLIKEQEFGMSAASLIRFLDMANVEARPAWKPMHTQPLYRGFECTGGQVAEDINRRGICLPSSSSLTEDQQRFVIHCVREAHRRSWDRQTGESPRL